MNKKQLIILFSLVFILGVMIGADIALWSAYCLSK